MEATEEVYETYIHGMWQCMIRSYFFSRSEDTVDRRWPKREILALVESLDAIEKRDWPDTPYNIVLNHHTRYPRLLPREFVAL